MRCEQCRDDVSSLHRTRGDFYVICYNLPYLNMRHIFLLQVCPNSPSQRFHKNIMWILYRTDITCTFDHVQVFYNVPLSDPSLISCDFQLCSLAWTFPAT